MFTALVMLPPAEAIDRALCRASEAREELMCPEQKVTAVEQVTKSICAPLARAVTAHLDRAMGSHVRVPGESIQRFLSGDPSVYLDDPDREGVSYYLERLLLNGVRSSLMVGTLPVEAFRLREVHDEYAAHARKVLEDTMLQSMSWDELVSGIPEDVDAPEDVLPPWVAKTSWSCWAALLERLPVHLRPRRVTRRSWGSVPSVARALELLLGDIAHFAALLMKKQFLGYVLYRDPETGTAAYCYYRHRHDLSGYGEEVPPDGGKIVAHATGRKRKELYLHTLRDMREVPLTEFSERLPERVAAYRQQIPEWVAPHLRVLSGTIVQEDVHLLGEETKREQWETSRLVPKHSPAYTLGDLVLTGWCEDDLQDEWACQSALRADDRARRALGDGFLYALFRGFYQETKTPLTW